MSHSGPSLMYVLYILILLIVSFNLCTNGQKLPTENEKEEIVVDDLLPKEVVVIGAGIAGLAAARRLSADKQNFTVKVYEARRDRYGGRIWTDKLTNMKARGAEVDLGGSALSVISKENPLIELAEKFDLKVASVQKLQFIIPWKKISYSGDDLSKITHQAAQILGQAVNESKTEKIEVSMKEAIDKVLGKRETEDLDSAAAHLVRCLPSYILDNYSSRNYKPENIDVGYDKLLLDGMGELIDRLVSGSTEEPPLHLNLNKAARQIKVDKGRRKVLVRFHGGVQVAADIVVVAVPVSVIASGELLFEPDLPKKYQLALHEISISAGNKVIVEFEHAFWSAEYGVFTRAVRTDAERGNLQTWVNVNNLIGHPVLIGLLFGQPAVEFEILNPEEAKNYVIDVLNEMFGEDLVKQGGKVVRFQHSKWVTDPLSLGASTYPKVGSDPGLWDTFSQPLCPYIYFAGEHTSFEAHGTLHGAYNSGIRVGDQILTGLCETLRKEEERRIEEARRKKEEQKNATKDDKLDDSLDDDVNIDEDEDDTVEEVAQSKKEKTEL
uniref:Amine oxidase domain-containing protein n=1 Tax=Arion vulgaris TaxID=1028688 RepID=A0A0B6ZZ31_9EUPU